MIRLRQHYFFCALEVAQGYLDIQESLTYSVRNGEPTRWASLAHTRDSRRSAAPKHDDTQLEVTPTYQDHKTQMGSIEHEDITLDDLPAWAQRMHKRQEELDGTLKEQLEHVCRLETRMHTRQEELERIMKEHAQSLESALELIEKFGRPSSTSGENIICTSHARQLSGHVAVHHLVQNAEAAIDSDAARGEPAAESEGTGNASCDPEGSTWSGSLQDSIWDAALLIGLEGQGVACTVWAMIVLVLNGLMQAIFTKLILQAWSALRSCGGMPLCCACVCA